MMKLIFEEEDVKRALLRHALTEFGLVFDNVEYEAGYGEVRAATLSKSSAAPFPEYPVGGDPLLESL